MIGHYLMFNGNCAEALATYQKVFSGKLVEMQKYGDMPANPAFPVPDEKKNHVLHATLDIGGAQLMCADSSEPSKVGDNMFVTVTSKDAELVKSAWTALLDGATVFMELQSTFFAAHHGSLRDKYGVNWMFTAMK